jgi:hypothetical protein
MLQRVSFVKALFYLSARTHCYIRILCLEYETTSTDYLQVMNRRIRVGKLDFRLASLSCMCGLVGQCNSEIVPDAFAHYYLTVSKLERHLETCIGNTFVFNTHLQISFDIFLAAINIQRVTRT